MPQWKVHEIVLRLKTPLHSGASEWGNLLVTNPFLPARALWGALTAFLTREAQTSPTNKDYQDTGNYVQESLAFTYFYPCLKSDQTYTCYFPWESKKEEVPFHARFIGSYVSTALQGTQKAAEEASLHEIEFLSPFTRDGTDKPVYLMGYIFSQANSSNDKLSERVADILSDPSHDFWRNAQFGAERSYGWGRVECISINNHSETCWDTYEIQLTGKRPTLKIPKNHPIPAPLIFHPDIASKISGHAQPLVRRAWGTHPGEKIAFDGMAYAIGAVLRETCALQISQLGYLEYPNVHPSK